MPLLLGPILYGARCAAILLIHRTLVRVGDLLLLRCTSRTQYAATSTLLKLRMLWRSKLIQQMGTKLPPANTTPCEKQKGCAKIRRPSEDQCTKSLNWPRS